MECEIPPAPISQNSGRAFRIIRPHSARYGLPFSHPLDPDGKSSGPERPPANRSICGPGEVSYFADRTPPRWGRSSPIVPSRKGGAHPGTHDAMSLTHRATIMAVMDRDAMRYSDVLMTLSMTLSDRTRAPPRAARVASGRVWNIPSRHSRVLVPQRRTEAQQELTPVKMLRSCWRRTAVLMAAPHLLACSYPPGPVYRPLATRPKLPLHVGSWRRLLRRPRQRRRGGSASLRPG